MRIESNVCMNSIFLFCDVYTTAFIMLYFDLYAFYELLAC
jgi:hypothetical protein